MKIEHLQAAADAVAASADVWTGFSAQDAKVCVEAYLAASNAKPCLHIRLNVDTCEDCGAKFEFA
ncbi:hypothetical protein AWB74_02147 [Caballeronia arvi]|uniref:Uncharacterized protein n=1 Tax=Caballeronia arvi TaxID=1777135 RepID=A0A158HUD9_9BURK|nr:hypothetical protein [Caballeronia arvi]SAL47579.1 hypothetical protein AWB74_02147 [Caballeronia arvi]